MNTTQTKKKIVTYVLITFGLSFAAYALIALGREEGEGLALAISWSIVALLFWLKRDSLPLIQRQNVPSSSKALDPVTD